MKKWFSFIFIILFVFTTSSCDHSTTSKFVLEGEQNITSAVELSAEDLQYKIEQEENFVLYIKLLSCGTCESFYQNILKPYITANNAKIYSIYSSELDLLSYTNKPRYTTNPTICIIQNGKTIKTLNYKKSEAAFQELGAFETFMSEYVIKPNKITISEVLLDQKIEEKETFILYIGWNKCGDCKSLEEEFLNSYLQDESKVTPIYYLESDTYRAHKPTSLPTLPENASEEEKEEYETNLAYYNAWLAFATKYQFVSYRDGKVPTLQYYLNGQMSNMIVYKNDSINEQNVITNSFYSDLLNQSYSSEQLLQIHIEKVKNWFATYYK